MRTYLYPNTNDDLNRCLTVELITEFLFGRDVNMIEASENTFDADFLEIFEGASTGQPELLFYPILCRIKFALPGPLLFALDKKLAKLLQIGEVSGLHIITLLVQPSLT